MTVTDPVDQFPISARNASLEELAAILQVQHDAKLDVVVPAVAITSRDGMLHVAGAGPDGPIGPAGIFRPTAVCDEGIAAKLGIPLAYLRRMRDNRPDLYDANVNGWLRGTAHHPMDAPVATPDPKSYLLRTFVPADGDEGIARAFLSKSYKRVDNLDYLMALLDGARAASATIEVRTCDLTERRMQVRLVAPEVNVIAGRFLERYRSPFNGKTGTDLPLIFAGLVAANSETGNGAWSVAPRLEVQVCTNGLIRATDMIRGVHVGAKMEDGIVQWSEETQQRNLDLIRAQTRDAVATFLNVEYVQHVIDEIEERAATPITNPAEAVQVVANRLRYSEAQMNGILDHFIKGGDVTAGGVMQAVTSYAQTVADADEALDLELSALLALDAAVMAAKG